MTKIMEIILYRINNVAFIEFSNCQTENENEVLKIMHLFSSNYKNEKEKATTENARLSPCVAFTYKLSNKFIEDFERIIEFIERRHIAL